MIYQLEDRIQRLRAALMEISRGTLGILNVAKFARDAVETDDRLAERYRTDVRGGDD